MKKYLLLLGACILLGSCSTPETPATTQATQTTQGSGTSALLYLSCRAVSQDEIEFVFSRPVTIKQLNFEPELEIASMENGSTVKVQLKERVALGVLITADLIAEDDSKNTINVIDSFRTRNDRMPKLVINEICTEMSKPKSEFIELRMLSDGNLGAMRLFILGNTTAAKETIYEFLPCEVKKNQYVTLHLRTLEESCKDEYDGNISESGGANSSDTAWDFWIPGDKKLVQTAAATIYVLDQDDNVLDAVMISKTPDSWWAKDYFAEAAEFLFNRGAWKSSGGGVCSPADAVISTGAANTQTICRDETVEDSDTAKDWYITDKSCASPGKPNNPRRLK